MGNFTQSPFIDVDNGGDIDGVIKTVRATLTLINDDTIVVPGHGDIGGKKRLVEFAEYLETVRDQIKAFKEGGKTAEDVQAAYTQGDLTGTAHPLLIDRAYHSVD